MNNPTSGTPTRNLSQIKPGLNLSQLDESLQRHLFKVRISLQMRTRLTILLPVLDEQSNGLDDSEPDAEGVAAVIPRKYTKSVPASETAEGEGGTRSIEITYQT